MNLGSSWVNSENTGLIICSLGLWDISLHPGHVHRVTETKQTENSIVVVELGTSAGVTANCSSHLHNVFKEAASAGRRFHEDYASKHHIAAGLVEHWREIGIAAREAANNAAEAVRNSEDLSILIDCGMVPLPPTGLDLLPSKLEESIWQRASEAGVTKDEILLSDMAFFTLPTCYVPLTPPMPDPSSDGYKFSDWMPDQYLDYCRKIWSYGLYSLHFEYELDIKEDCLEDYWLARKRWCDMQELAQEERAE
ncbi:hypothetical protein BT96DRAFT_990117 [Gymnopus androsaceus JB14]|uniref:Uncharacterized protein n=1 Tax=Gymnopus androsaceus JB14 TaxID=1447944 RepID=A0A6A4I3E3_9AGAR|nr:hypothetical protein BT96DRAFT_990117 [Gymnopus androsaceus JB14]